MGACREASRHIERHTVEEDFFAVEMQDAF